MPTRVLLWTDTPAAYLDAIAAADLTSRVTVEALPRKDTPTQAQRADTEAMLAWGAPPGLLPQMAKLRWVQALTAGVEGWLALPDLPPTLTLTCARGTHRESMAENILGALFHLTKPYAAIVQDQKHSKWVRRVATPLAGQTLGILGLGAIGQQVAHIAYGHRHARHRHQAPRAEPLPHLDAVLPPEHTDEVLAQSDFVLLLLPATPDTENFINAQRLAQDEAHRLAAELRPWPPDRRCRPDRGGQGRSRSPARCWTCSARNRCRPNIRSGPPRASSSCPISAAATRSATRRRGAAVRGQPAPLPRRRAAEGGGGPHRRLLTPPPLQSPSPAEAGEAGRG